MNGDDTNGRNTSFETPTATTPAAPRGPERLVRMAGQARERLQESTDWLQAHHAGEVRTELETRIRALPLLSVALAVTAGFLLGRMLRD